jgi:phospholipase C
VTGPNRFLRRFTGDTAAAGKDLTVEAAYYEGRASGHPELRLTLRNTGRKPVTFTVRHNHYVSGAPRHIRVAPHGHETWTVDAVRLSEGWYDVTVTADADASWSQRFTGHLETGRPSITG